MKIKQKYRMNEEKELLPKLKQRLYEIALTKFKKKFFIY